MKFIKVLFIFTLTSQVAFADSKYLADNNEKNTSTLSENLDLNDIDNFAAKGRSTPTALALRGAPIEKWYDVTAPVFPHTADLSRKRNKGETKGFIGLSNKGVEIKEDGNYSISYTAILQNQVVGPTTARVTAFLVRNGKFKEKEGLRYIPGSILNVPSTGQFIELDGSGVLFNLKAGEKLSIRISSSTSSPVTLTVVSWRINVVKID